jgi:hypothetical protein
MLVPAKDVKATFRIDDSLFKDIDSCMYLD